MTPGRLPFGGTEDNSATGWNKVHNAAAKPSKAGAAEGKVRRDRGMKKAVDHAAEAFLVTATAAWDRVCREKEYVTSDDLWMTIDLSVASPNLGKVIGAIIRASAKRGQVQSTGAYRKTARASGHARAVAVWRSLIWKVQ